MRGLSLGTRRRMRRRRANEMDRGCAIPTIVRLLDASAEQKDTPTPAYVLYKDDGIEFYTSDLNATIARERAAE